MKKSVRTKIKTWELTLKESPFSHKNDVYYYQGDSLESAVNAVFKASNYYYVEFNQKENTVSIFQGQERSYAAWVATYFVNKIFTSFKTD